MQDFRRLAEVQPTLGCKGGTPARKGRAYRVMPSARQLSPRGGCLEGSAEASKDVLSNCVHMSIQQHSLQLPFNP